jgi:hypothetical protein
MKTPPVARSQTDMWPGIFTGFMGVWLGFVVFKLGNPVILDEWVRPAPGGAPAAWLGGVGSAPVDQSLQGTGLLDFLFHPVSFVWGLYSLGLLLLLGLKAGRWQISAPRWLIGLPAAWLVWQVLAWTQSVDAVLSNATLAHFAACVVCFYLGLFVLGHTRSWRLFWASLTVGFLLVLWVAFTQHYGGLEQIRRELYEQPNWQQFPAELTKRVTSGRVFGTMIYPNALAGLILILLPPTLVAVTRLSYNLPRVARGVIVGLLAYSALACLVWSGSKAGWLIGLGMLVILLFRLPLPRTLKWFSLGAVLVVGLATFSIRYARYFERGATSVSARMDYWQAAWQTALGHPVLGTGPGTFSIAYRARKTPESEMTRLCHNDYLEQASDSGLMGFLLYIGFFPGTLAYLYRKRCSNRDWLVFCIWLGLAGWAAQGMVEFGLYIPALAWPAFTLLGWLLGLGTQGNGIDKPR